MIYRNVKLIGMRELLLKILVVIIIANFSQLVYGQEYNPIITATPSLQIAPDSRGSGMGDTGAATTPDIYSQHWNPAKYPFINSKGGVAVSYTPWLSNISGGMDMIYTTGFWKFGYDNMNAISASLRYFSLGDVEVVSSGSDFFQNISPHEFAIDMSYSRKLSNSFSGSVTLRYIHADYSKGDDTTTPGNAFAADIAGYNESYVQMGHSEVLLGFGFNLSNIGTKISYDGGTTSMFLPANLRVGMSTGYPINAKSTLTVSLDLNKLLVPTPWTEQEGDTVEDIQSRIDKYNETSSIAGIFKSFGDAPGGASEKLKEIAWSLGAEYMYDNQFLLRAGYHNENKYKGNRRYISFGAGFQTKLFQIDTSYLISTSPMNPLDKTLRVSLGINLDRYYR